MPEEIETRWNATYEFLHTCYIYKDPITLTFNQYATKYPELMLYDADWTKVNDVKFLEKFYLATIEFSGTYYPTVCNILAYITEIAILLSEYRLKKDYTDAVDAMIIEYKKYFYPIPPIYLVGAILNPCMKYSTMSEMVHIIYTSIKIKETEKPSLFDCTSNANNHIESLYNHYANLLDNAMPTPVINPTTTFEGPSSSKRQAQGMPAYGVPNLSLWSRVQRPTQRPVNRDELNYYLRQPVEIVENQTQMSTLEWWKMSERQYPVLSILARDVLNVPMSTVASESAFSQGRQQIGDHRHSLGSNCMNALVCLRDWIRAERRNQRMSDYREEESLEEIMTIGDPSVQASPIYGAIDYDNPKPLPTDVNVEELE